MKGSKIGHYEVGGRLGAGGMGVVYRATDTRLRRDVALKLLPLELAKDPVARARFVREAQAASALEHPGIETIYEIGEHDDQLFIAMALYEGETLRERMSREPLSVEECESILRQLLEAVEVAHEAGVVHRDLKPGNVMLTRTGTSRGGLPKPLRVKVVDFGLAKLKSESHEESATRLTQQGSLMGTVAYMSPEQARGDAVDGRADLWSIGVMAYEMLAGRNPFEAPSSIGTLTRIATEDPKPLEHLRAAPEYLRQLVAGLLQKDPAQRLASAGDALAVLGQVEVIRPPASGVRPAWLRGWRLASGLGVVVAIAAAAVIATRWTEQRAPARVTTGASVVVLPCQVVAAREFYADAVPSNLSNLLVQGPGVEARLPPRAGKVDPVPAPNEMRQLAQDYRVRNLITCTVTGTGEKAIHLAVNVIDPQTSNMLWGDSYEGTEEGYLDLVLQSAQGIRQELAPQSVGAIAARGVASEDSRIELAFQRGKYYSERFNNKREPRDAQLALEAFEQVLALDPGLGDAAAEIAILRLWMGGPDAMLLAERTAREALEIDDSASRAWTVLAFKAWVERDREEGYGLRHALDAIRSDPTDGLAYYALSTSLKLSSTSLARTAAGHATEVDPLYAWGFIGEGSGLFLDGRLDEALATLDRALEIETDNYAGNAYRCVFLATKGWRAEARSAYRMIEDLEEASPAYHRLLARFALDLVEETERDAGALLEEVCGPDDFMCYDETYRFLIPLLLEKGELDLAVAVLSKYEGFDLSPAYDWLMLNPDVAALREHPRFDAIERGARAQYVAFREVLEGARQRGELPEFLESTLDTLDRRLPAVAPALARRSG